ncbi:MAG: hypothetical protein R3F34_09825 [Planctomycetota bacterium]
MLTTLASLLVPNLLLPAQVDLRSADQDVSFSYVEAGYVNRDVDGSSVEFDGFDAGFSFDLRENFHVAARGDVLRGKSGIDPDARSIAVLLGYHHELRHGTFLVAEAGLGWAEVEPVTGPDDSDSGFVARLGARHRANRTWEFLLALDYEDVGADDDVSVTGEVLAYVDDGIAVVGRASFGSEVDSLGIGVRIGL